MAGRKRGRPRREAREWLVTGAFRHPSTGSPSTGSTGSPPEGSGDDQAEAGMEFLLAWLKPEMDAIFTPGVNAAWGERGLLAQALFAGKQVVVVAVASS